MRRPKLVISRCLGFENCRYNGQGSSSKLIDTLKDHVEFCTVCPEVEIGLPTPREAIRIVDYDNDKRLIQHKTYQDHTNNMKEFSKKYINNLEDIDGFILKSRSPSCGFKDTKVYHKSGQSTITSNSNGFFTDEVVNSYGYLPIENEGRLKNYSIRDEFLTKLFMINDFKNNKASVKEFHKKNSLLLETYNLSEYCKLCKIIENDYIAEEDINKYEYSLYNILKSNRSPKKNIQILLDIYNKYDKNISMKEKEIFVDNVVKYSKEKLPFNTLLNNIKLYAARFDDDEVLQQSIFNPYPESLLNISDSGKGRSL